MNGLVLSYLLLFLLLFNIPAYSEENSFPIPEQQEVLQNLVKEQAHDQLQFELPINVYDKNIILSVQIPKGFTQTKDTPGNPHIIQFENDNMMFTIANQTGGEISKQGIN